MASRRPAGAWAEPPAPAAAAVDVLIPTAGRVAELAVTLAGLAAQDDPPFRVVISDQSDDDTPSRPAVAAMIRVLRAQGRGVEVRRHLPRRGMAEQRQFLLELSSAQSVLFLDDDVWLEPGQLARMHDALVSLGCGFVGMAVQGLSYLDDDRPQEREAFEPWPGRVEPEQLSRASAAFERWRLHNAANLTHLAREVELPERGWLPYRVAWIGGCAMFRHDVLIESGGFEFWRELGPQHAGEDVLAQWRVMARRGGAGLLPSGAVHLEAPTTIPDRPFDAFDVVDV